MPSIFSRIIAGEIPCHKIAENEQYFSFLDISPLALGHTLVIPKIEVDYIYDLDDNILAGLLPFSKHIAKALEKTIPCARIGISVIGLEVPHAHVHLIPMQSVADLNFERPKMVMEAEALSDLAVRIRANL